MTDKNNYRANTVIDKILNKISIVLLTKLAIKTNLEIVLCCFV